MYTQKLEKYLESIGKSMFIKYFESFKNNTFLEDCKENISSKKMRQKFANFIFVNNLELDALDICINAKISETDKSSAQKLIENLKYDEPFSDDFRLLLQYNTQNQSKEEYLLKLLSGVYQELRKSNMIRGKNIVGDLAEYYVLSYFNKNINLPNLTMETQSNRGYDLLDQESGKRYQVKGITQIRTSNFHLENSDDDLGFDYIVIVKLDVDFLVEEMYLLDAKHFDKVKKQRGSSNTYYINFNKRFKDLAKKIIG